MDKCWCGGGGGGFHLTDESHAIAKALDVFSHLYIDLQLGYQTLYD